MVSRRVVRSYQARYSMGANKASMYDLADAIDVHAHARGQDEEEPMHAAQEATRAGMKAVLFKSISPGRPWEVARRLQDDVDRVREVVHRRLVGAHAVPRLVRSDDSSADHRALARDVIDVCGDYGIH